MEETDRGGASPAGQSVSFDRAADFYDATRGFPPGVERRAAELIARTAGLHSDARVLEVGIGTGRIARPLARHVRGMVGVDISRAMMKRLLAQWEFASEAETEAGWIELAEADATRLPFADDSFDAAIGAHVFHLIPGWREVIAEIARVLRPGAPLIHARDTDRMEEVWRLYRERSGSEPVVPDVGLSRAKAASFLEDAGWQPTGPVEKITFSESVFLPDYLDRFAQRSWSSTWRMADDELRDLVDGLRAAVIELYGSVDQTVESPVAFFARAYHPPPGDR